MTSVHPFQECQEVGVDRGCLRGRHAVREVLIGLQGAVLQQLCRQWSGSDVGNDLIVFAVHHQHRHGDLLEVFGEIGLREGDDAVVVRLGAAHHALAPPVRDDRLRGFCPRPVVAIEGPLRQSAIELRAVGRELRLQIVKYCFGKAVRIGHRPHHQRRHRADQGRLRHPIFAVPSQIVRHLAAAGGVADVNGVFQIEMRRQSGKVVGIVIHVMAVARLGRSTVAAAIMGDDAIAVIEEEQHLIVPVIGRQRPTMAEHDGLTFAPVLVIDLRTVFGRNEHCQYSLVRPWLLDGRNAISAAVLRPAA